LAGSQAREVMMTLEEYEQMKAQMAIDKHNGFSDMQDDEPIVEYDEADEDDDEQQNKPQIKEVEYDNDNVEAENLNLKM